MTKRSDAELLNDILYNDPNINSSVKKVPADEPQLEMPKYSLASQKPLTQKNHIWLLLYMFILYIVINLDYVIELLPNACLQSVTNKVPNTLGTIVQAAIYVFVYVILYILVTMDIL